MRQQFRPQLPMHLMNRRISLAFALFIFATSCTTKSTDTLKTEELTVGQQLEEMANELVYFSADAFMAGQTIPIKPDHRLQKGETRSSLEKDLPVIATQQDADRYYETSMRIIRQLSLHRWDADELILLLDHPDAKVRTLAAAALIATDEPANIPPLAKLLHDKSQTFPAAPLPLYQVHHSGLSNSHLYRQTVSQAVAQLLAPYMPNNFMVNAFLNGKRDVKAEFEKNWKAREYPAATFHDFEIWRRRAWGEVSDSEEIRNERLQRIRKRLTEIPMPDRAWYAMGNSITYTDITQRRRQQLLSDESIVELARNVGHEKLMRTVAQQIEPTEMFLQPPPAANTRLNFGEDRLCPIRNFILQHPKELLKPSDADQLLAMAVKAKSNNDGMWFSNLTSAAAELQPHRAVAILHDAFEVLPTLDSIRDSHLMAIALWKYGGLSERAFLVDWFYYEMGVSTMRITNMPQFLIQADMTSEPDGRILITSIIKDSRLERLNWIMTKWLVGIVNRRLNPPWFKLDDVGLMDPSFFVSVSESIQHNQKETIELISLWQARLRERISEYEQVKRK